MKAYSDLFSKATPTAYPGQSVIAEINNVGDKVYRVVEFTLERATPVRIYGIGEGTPTKMYDFGGIENTRTGKLIWLMNYYGTVHAGGDTTNRLVNRVTSLPQGTYRLHFRTDKNHSFEHWMLFPPDHAFWGISLYEEKSTGPGDITASRRAALIIPPEEITPSHRLLDSAITGEQQESMVDPLLELILTICGVIFLLAIIIWPVGALIRFLKSRKLKAATISKKKSRPSAVGTFMAWVNGVLGLFFVSVAVVRGALEFYLTYGFDDTQAFDVKLIFMITPLVSACILVLLVGFTFFEWRKRHRSPIGRWFFTLFTAASIVFVLVCYHYYLMLYA